MKGNVILYPLRERHHNRVPSASSSTKPRKPSATSSEVNLNDNLTESGKLYVNKVLENRESTSRASSIKHFKTDSQSIENTSSINRNPSSKSNEGAASQSGSLFGTESAFADGQNTSMDQEGDLMTDDEENTDVVNGDDEDVVVLYGPYAVKLAMLQRSIAMDLSSLNELLESGSPDQEAWSTIKTSARDKKLVSMLSKQRDINNVWIQSVKDLEIELIEKSNRLASLDKERRNLKKLLQKGLVESSEPANVSEPNLPEETPNALEEIAKFIDATKGEDEGSDADEFYDAEELSEQVSGVTEVETQERPAAQEDEKKPASSGVDEVTSTIAVTPEQEQKGKLILSEGTYLGYEDGIRKRLKLDKDDRPSVSLWSVLKSMVGKDMTRMTLPVTFNEPTSLLQRVAEDLEYTHLLDEAASFEDPTLRLLYVGVFTASSYASTIKRVAKPFNPLLGETFEYARPDKHFRFFTEQVSHHPPISATWTESPKWDFYGESNVDSKFNGRSFAFKHLGWWHNSMRPDDKSPDELYTWKKPDNTVIGILVGNPQVDNHGDVKIVNHTTGDYCMLNFKARGWRSSGAYEVRGEVFNKKGQKMWVLGGHWNDTIYGKKVTAKDSGEIPLQKTATASSSAFTGPKFDGSKFLIWKTAPRPDAPFNLTTFAITLNAPQPKLLPWLAPTDTRLRPDQRDMEDGRYDEAAKEKHRVEEKQRAERKKRESKNEKYCPKWFVQEQHPITKNKYWRFNGNYWMMRKEHKLKNCGDIF